MIVDIKIPSPGESITEVEIAQWIVNNGDIVQKDQDIFVVESEKATLVVTAEESGKIQILFESGKSVKVGEIVCKIDTVYSSYNELYENKTSENKQSDNIISNNEPQKTEVISQIETSENQKNIKITPLAKKIMQEKNLSVDDVINGLRRIWKEDVEAVAELKDNFPVKEKEVFTVSKNEINRQTTEEKMSMLRRKLSERLVSVKNETAMLTTFNEVDMSSVMEIRNQYQNKFTEKYKVKIGFLSFFVKAATQALMKFPDVNAMIKDENILYHKFADIGIAVQSKKGLMVPVLRNTETMNFADIELKIKEFGLKAIENKLTLDEITGGTFTITNGGTFGSLLSTPIINPPQSAILGMHNIVERPIAVKGKVEIRPMMYIALSYDHRIIDGKSAVGFLVKVKELIENPVNMLFGNENPTQLLLDI